MSNAKCSAQFVDSIISCCANYGSVDRVQERVTFGSLQWHLWIIDLSFFSFHSLSLSFSWLLIRCFTSTIYRCAMHQGFVSQRRLDSWWHTDCSYWWKFLWRSSSSFWQCRGLGWSKHVFNLFFQLLIPFFYLDSFFRWSHLMPSRFRHLHAQFQEWPR